MCTSLAAELCPVYTPGGWQENFFYPEIFPVNRYFQKFVHCPKNCLKRGTLLISRHFSSGRSAMPSRFTSPPLGQRAPKSLSLKDFRNYRRVIIPAGGGPGACPAATPSPPLFQGASRTLQIRQLYVNFLQHFSNCLTAGSSRPQGETLKKSLPGVFF
jgi:hypothetical protein